MAHGHSHGGGGGKKSKDENSHKRDDDAMEMADREYLCSDERIAVEENDHGHSHTAEIVQSNHDTITNGDTKSNKKKKGCKEKNERKKKSMCVFILLRIFSGRQSDEYSWSFSSCIE